MDIKGKDILRNPFFNKGTAFTIEERKKYKLNGILPHEVRTIEQQEQLVYKKLSLIESDIDKNNFLMNLYDTNRTLFYYTVKKHIEELMPVIYTPTIGDAVIDYSENYFTPKDAVFITAEDKGNIKEILENSITDSSEIKIIVVTDGEGVLGIGDWGVNGVNISVGKLAVYTVAAGIDPKTVLPVILDVGTNNEQLLNDEFYLGVRKKRISGEEYDSLVEEFVDASQELFPEALVHWEDFGRDNAYRILDKYRDNICTFNDDIQGTGVMMVSALNAVAKVTKVPVKDQRIVIFGGGTAGIGVSDQILLEKIKSGMKKEDAIKQFYIVDRYGLVTDDMENLTEGQRRYARKSGEFKTRLTELKDIIKEVKPDVLIGSSGQHGAFTEEVVKNMAEGCQRPAIMPISNPTKLSEAKAEDIIRWSDGKALVVTGSPSKPVQYKETEYVIGQANNALLYPGLGLGIVAAKAKKVTDNMLLAASHAIAELQDLARLGAPVLPPVRMISESSKLVAEAVVKQAIKDGVCRADYANNDAETLVKNEIWIPQYR